MVCRGQKGSALGYPGEPEGLMQGIAASTEMPEMAGIENRRRSLLQSIGQS